MSIDMSGFLKKFNMRKMHKIINIALIFILIWEAMCQKLAYAEHICLRVPFFSQRQDSTDEFNAVCSKKLSKSYARRLIKWAEFELKKEEKVNVEIPVWDNNSNMLGNFKRANEKVTVTPLVTEELISMITDEESGKKIALIFAYIISKDDKNIGGIVETLAKLNISEKIEDLAMGTLAEQIDLCCNHCYGLKHRIYAYKLSQLNDYERNLIEIATLAKGLTHNYISHYKFIGKYIKNLKLSTELIAQFEKIGEPESERIRKATERGSHFFRPFDTDHERAKLFISEEIANFKAALECIKAFEQKMFDINIRDSKLLENLSILEGNVKGFIDIAERGKINEEKTKSVNVNDLLLSLVGVIKRVKENENFEIITNLQQDISPVLGNPGELQQVFLNIINNAKIAINSKPAGYDKLIISSQSRGDSIIVKISDTGVGIAEEHKARIFEPYFTTRKDSGGTGIGLAFCKRIIEKHKGAIDFESELGKGTTFTITLPVAPRSVSPHLGKSSKEVVFIELLKQEFPGYLNAGIPLQILDIGTGLNGVFTFKLNKLLHDNGIKAKIYGIAPNILEKFITEAQNEGIVLIPTCYEDLIEGESERGKYNIITVNAPAFIMDVDKFFNALNYLLTPDGVVIIRLSTGYDNEDTRDNIKFLLENTGLWVAQNLKEDIRDLPTGRRSLLPPLLIKRAFQINQSFHLDKATQRVLQINI